MSTHQPVRRQAASAKSEQRIRDILRMGREVLAERGYERATTTDIAQRLGISEATVFTYFSSKRELCVRVIEDWYDEIIARMEAGMPADCTVREQFEYFVHTHLQLFLVQGTGLCALVLSEGRSKGQSLGDDFVKLQRRYTAPLMDLLARGQLNGEIRSDIPLRVLRHMVLGPMEHVLWEVIAQGDSPDKPINIDSTVKVMVLALWQAMAAPGQELHVLRRFKSSVEAALDQAQQSN